MSGPAPEFRIAFPAELPISAKRQEIGAALEANRVVVVCGDTGSGKTTQLPKICLEAGLGRNGLIGHTQPRRLAARAVAERLAEELGVELGAEVGYQIRFNDRTDARTRVKLMTDGILLNEIRRDRLLRAYDTLIIDEAHERSLNVDFLLGYLKLVLEQRDDLRIVITSATVDPGRFARYFDGAPVIEVEGRQHPIAVEYDPPADDEDTTEAVLGACHRLARADLAALGGGEARDILVFLPGERWIRDLEQALARSGPAGFDVLPLYARLATKRQARIFEPGPAPRIVLATNVAETSLTVPRIRFVVDTGLARVSRYSARHRIQTLGVEPIARANAAQRAGRCGRIAPGICVRLYTERAFEERPEFPDPEILRTNLAEVILRLEALGLGHIDDFPFLDTPPVKTVNDAFRLLQVLGALDADHRLTRDGRSMGRLPLDPRLSRLLLAARKTRCLADALVLAAALSVIDPREQPGGTSEQQRERMRQLEDERSDFTTYLNIWRAYRDAQKGGARRLAAWCKDCGLVLSRLREWQDVHSQLGELVKSFGWRRDDGRSDPATLHRAVLGAFVDFIAERDDGQTYRGMHDSRARLFPGTRVASRRPRWIVAAEHVATERNYLRIVAQINPRWVPQVAPQVVRRDHRDPAWDPARGQVTAAEIVSAFGLVLGRDRRVAFAPIDAAQARAIFLRDGLAADALGAEAGFLRHNRRVRATLLEWEARLRSRDLYIGDRGLEQFYAERLPVDVVDRRSLLDWLERAGNARRLEAAPADLATRTLPDSERSDYPDMIEVAGQKLPLRYRYEPGDERDGIGLSMPLLLLDAARPEAFEWLVPGWLAGKTLALLKTLPKEQRRSLVPLPDTVAEILPALRRRFGHERLLDALCAVLAESGRGEVPRAAFRPERLDPHWQIRIELVGEQGEVLAVGRDIEALQREYGGRQLSPGRTAPARSEWERTGLRHWDFGDLPETVAVDRFGTRLELYPGLVDRGAAVDLTLLPLGPASRELHRGGVRRLLLLQLPQQTSTCRGRILGDKTLLLAYHGIGSGDELVDDVLLAAADECFELDEPVRGAAEFRRRLAAGRAELVPTADRLVTLIGEVAARARTLRAALEAPDARPEAARRDLLGQLGELVHPRCLQSMPSEWRRHLPRYLEAMSQRWEKLRARSPRDAEYQRLVERAWQRYAARRECLPPGWPEPAALVRYRWLIEELRVSLFAQALGTAVPVSAKRLDAAWQELTS